MSHRLPVFHASLLWTVFAGLGTPSLMEQKRASQGSQTTAKSREDRLKAALKANMAKRKAQARARKASDQKKEA